MNKPQEGTAAPTEPKDTSVLDELAPLLEPPFAALWDTPAPGQVQRALRGRLIERMSASQAAEAPMTLHRRRRTARAQLAAGVTQQLLYESAASPLRPGEPLRVRLLDLAAGAALGAAELGGHAFEARHRELLVLQGQVALHGRTLAANDYHVLPAGAPMPTLHSDQGATVFVRESDTPAGAGDTAHTVLDADAGWPDFAPGIQRRVLWQRDGMAAMLYLVAPGAMVPHHRHGHDEECLMVRGELFLDDVLLQAGDYQLAPAGTGHRITETDTDVVLYAHGDLDLQFVS